MVNDYKCTINHWFPTRKEGAEVSHSEPLLPLSGVMQALALLASMQAQNVLRCLRSGGSD